MKKLALAERLAAVECLLRTRHAADPEAFISHTDIVAVLDVKPPDPAYYHVVGAVRTALLEDDIALGTYAASSDREGGYEFLRADQHAKRNRAKFALLVEHIREEVVWAEAFVKRVLEKNEESGMSLAEFLMSKTFTIDARRAVDTFTGQMEALAAIRDEAQDIHAQRRKLEAKQTEDKNRLSRVREDKQAVIVSLKGKLRNREGRIRALEARGQQDVLPLEQVQTPQ